MKVTERCNILLREAVESPSLRICQDMVLSNWIQMALLGMGGIRCELGSSLNHSVIFRIDSLGLVLKLPSIF